MGNTKTYGIEIECLVPYMTGTELAAKLQNLSGLTVQFQTYNHTTCPIWKIVTDASLVSEMGMVTFEVVSPVLSGEEGFESIKKMSAALKTIGAKVNKTCGLHVHVGLEGVKPAKVREIIERYANMEAKIDAVMPESRRSNRYCAGMRNILTSIVSKSTIREMAQAQGGRYYKVNLQSYLRHGTIEFRQHSGTVEAEKIINWVKFCINMVEVKAAETSPVREKVIEMMNCGTSESDIRNFLKDHKSEYGIKSISETAILTQTKKVIGFKNDPFYGLTSEVIEYFKQRAESLR